MICSVYVKLEVKAHREKCQKGKEVKLHESALTEDECG